MNPAPAIVIDIDGVLCDNIQRQRDHIAAGAPVGETSPEWEGFSDGYSDDPPKTEYIRLAQWLDHSLTIVLLTCRDARHRRVTEDWLRTNHVPWDQLIMWDSVAHGYYEHKEVAIQNLMAEFEVKLVIEDSSAHARMFRSLGLPVILVPDGLSV